MPYDPRKPLLRLNEPRQTTKRRSGGGGSEARQFDRAAQVQQHGPIFQRLQTLLNRPDGVLQLRADATSLAPERLLVFEVTGSIQNFSRAVGRIDGLEYAGEEELIGDEFDKNPEFYLLVPQLDGLRNIISLWERWRNTGDLPRNYTPWRDLFAQLRDVRPWGPSDRVSQVNQEYFSHIVDGASDDEPVRIEIELVFRSNLAASQAAEAAIENLITINGGAIIDRSRRSQFAYHAILADVPAREVRRIASLDPTSLAGADPVASIVPQSVGAPIELADQIALDEARPGAVREDPIAAIFDAVPVQAHPLLAGRLTFDDPANLEAEAVGDRIHGTAMASIVLHGDLNDPASPISRRVYFRPVMYAPALGNEIFDGDRLVVDVIVEAVMRMRAGGGQNVIVVNLSLGDRTKPFSGRVSTWARALDFLAFTYGILFFVSAGNVGDAIPVQGFDNHVAFEAATPADRANAILRGLDSVKANRRLLAPAESVNALTIGSWHRDAAQEIFPGASPFVPFPNEEMPNLSSRVGPGVRRSTKPEVLYAGGRQHAKLNPIAVPPMVVAHHLPSRFWGLKVAAPPQGGTMGLHFTIGTSAATALATHTAHRAFDALEDAYPELIGQMQLSHRAALLKALVVHAASWRGSENFIRSVVDPLQELHHEHWRREVCRHLGYGFVDPDEAVACTADRATMWATGSLGPEGSMTFDVPIPEVFGRSAGPREVRATLAWFAPTRPGHLAYRAVKLRIPALGPDALTVAGVGTVTEQPTNAQSESGTVIHRRWHNAQIGSEPGSSTIPIQVQREKDQGTPIDEEIPFGLAVTVEMPNVVQVYDQVLARIQVQPRVRVRA